IGALAERKRTADMNKLTKSMLIERDGICERLHTAYEALEQAVDTYNEAMAAQWDTVESAVNAYNEVVEDANGWKEEVASEMQGYIEDRSEKWQEGERGQAYMAWQQEFSDHDLEAIDLDQPEPLALSTGAQGEILEGLAEEIG